MSAKPKILVAFRPSLYQLLYPPETDAALRAFGDVTFHDSEAGLTSEELAEGVPGFEAVLSSWGTPRFTEEVLDAADRLKIVAHTAGSIKNMLPRPVFEHGIVVTHAASAIAGAVADLSLALTMLLLRHVHSNDRLLRDGQWGAARDL
ncbi:MAG TPA: hypothetical protein VM366_10655, partial [Anaerolineae bacterium]|nr:hypothetical protein [Anaerolineae bacterium]